MSKISAIKDYHNGSFKSFNWPQKPVSESSPYYYDNERAKRENLKESEILENNFKTKASILSHKVANTLTVYPAKGFSGSRNSNFYENLTMGAFPYVAGGLTFIALFNGITKFLEPKAMYEARKYGLRMALGVIFFGIAKSLAKKFVSVPVKLKTGIDMDMPCRNVVNLISTTPEQYEAEQARQESLKKAGLPDTKGFEYHKVFESVDFPRFDLLYKKGENRNEYYDKIAKKNGFGENLKDSDQEVKPFIKSVVSKAKTAQNISQYLWAAVGLGIGVQRPWGQLYDLYFYRNPNIMSRIIFKDFPRKVFESAKESCKSFVTYGAVGKSLLLLAAATTVIGTINALRNPYIKNTKNMDNSNVFKDNRKVMED